MRLPSNSLVKALTWTFRILSWGVYVVIIVSLLVAAPVLLGYRPLVVLTDSMVPVYPVGSIIYYKAAEFDEINVEDSITFSIGTEMATHRVKEKNEMTREFVTKGDNNPTVDPNPVPYDRVVGRNLDLALPFLGTFTRMVQHWYVLVIMGVILVLAMIFSPEDKKDAEKKRKAAMVMAGNAFGFYPDGATYPERGYPERGYPNSGTYPTGRGFPDGRGYPEGSYPNNGVYPDGRTYPGGGAYPGNGYTGSGAYPDSGYPQQAGARDATAMSNGPAAYPQGTQPYGRQPYPRQYPEGQPSGNQPYGGGYPVGQPTGGQPGYDRRQYDFENTGGSRAPGGAYDPMAIYQQQQYPYQQEQRILDAAPQPMEQQGAASRQKGGLKRQKAVSAQDFFKDF